MQRNTWRTLYFLGGWTMASLAGVLVAACGYTVGYFDGYEDASPLMIPVTNVELVRTIAHSFNIPWMLPEGRTASSAHVPGAVSALLESDPRHPRDPR